MASSLLLALTCSLVAGQRLSDWKAPFEELPAPADASSLATHLQGAPTAVWQEGDVLTILHKEAAKQIYVTGGIQLPMKRIGESDLWITRLRMSGWDKALISYSFYSTDTAVIVPHDKGIWRGAKGPEPATEAADLKGTVTERTLFSASLNEDRKLTVYLPPNAPKKGLPAFFMADGGGCAAFAKVLEPLILSGKMRPVAIVGVHDGGYRGDPRGEFDFNKDYRGKEYVVGMDDERFAKHMAFFAGEVPPYVTREFGISPRREDHVVFGVSNGGGFSTCAALLRPDVFSQAIPMSHTQLPRPMPATPPPVKLHFVVGTLERSYEQMKATVGALQAKKVDASLTEYVAGHDNLMWKLAFSRLAPTIFPRRR
jgi:enterochelin esterase-like enzyme